MQARESPAEPRKEEFNFEKTAFKSSHLDL